MTGYGKAKAVLDSGTITFEIKTLNGKGSDASIKTSILPKDKELLVRHKLASSLVRGTIDFYATYEPNSAEGAKRINAELVGEYYRQVVGIRDSLSGSSKLPSGTTEGVDNDILMSVLRFPEVLGAQKAEIVNEENWPIVEAAIDQALAQVREYRSKEGEALYKDVTSRVRGILALEDEVEGFETERLSTVRERLVKNLSELGQKVDPSRFEQEMVFYLEKLDINEEKVRLRQHCKYFLDTIDGEPCPGKKLGFILQEMGREINTTGSKANHAGIQKVVVRMKDELEKIREQCLNIL